MLQRWPIMASMAGLLFFAACGPDEEDDSKNPGGDTAVIERDGIPSSNAADRLLYFVSSAEDGPGLYAVNPTAPDDPPTYVDPELNVVLPFHHAIHRADRQPDDTTQDFHAGGVFYNTYYSPPGAEGAMATGLMYGQQYLASTEPSQLGQPPRRIGDTGISGMILQGMGGLFSFGLNALEDSSFSTKQNEDAVRIDLSLGEDELPLEIPAGTILYSFLGEGVETHEHWLHLSDTGALSFYDRDLTTNAPLVDEDTGAPIEGVSILSRIIAQITPEEGVFAIGLKADEDDSELDAALYLIERPSDAHPNGRAKRLLNDQGEPLMVGVGFIVFGRAAPAEPLLFMHDEALYFGSGPSMFAGVWTTLTRLDRNGWSEFNHQAALQAEGKPADNPMLHSALPPVFIPLSDGRIFWAPGKKPEIIEPDSGPPLDWARTAIDAPEPKDTPIPTSANGWVYYHSEDDQAVALNPETGETLRFSDAQWLGASHEGTGMVASSVLQTALSEVFLYRPNGDLLALEAGAPDKGAVLLGTLPDTTEHIILHGLGRSPHRLLQLVHDDESAEVVYVDTRESGSLRHLMEAPAQEWERDTGVVLGDQALTNPVKPNATQPIAGF